MPSVPCSAQGALRTVTAIQRSALALVSVLLGLAVLTTGVRLVSDANPPARPEVEKDWGVIEGPAFKDGNPKAVAAGGPGFVAVGSVFNQGISAAAVWKSSDGLSWERVPDVAAFHDDVRAAPEMTGVVAGGPGLVAVGNILAPFAEHPAVWTSPDGLTWTRVPEVPALEGERMNAVVRGGPGVVAVGGGGRGAAIWTSADGLRWTRLPSTAELNFGNLTAVTADGPVLVAAGSTVADPRAPGAAPVWTSHDGLAWSRAPSTNVFHNGDILRGITVGGPGFVAVGSEEFRPSPANAGGRTRPVAWISPNGLTWTRAPVPISLGLGGTQMVGVVTMPGGPTLVAVGTGPKGVVVWTSPDGRNWTRVPRKVVFDGATVDAIAAGGPGLIVVGPGHMWVSPSSASPGYRVPGGLLFVLGIVALLLLAARVTTGKPRSAILLLAVIPPLLYLLGEVFGDQIETFLYDQFGQIGP